MLVLTVQVTFAGNPVANLDKGLFSRPTSFKERRSAQIKTRAFPTTTIGSFPQTTGLQFLPAKPRRLLSDGMRSMLQFTAAFSLLHLPSGRSLAH